MKIAYTGTPSELLPKQKAKMEAKLQKCLQSLERRGEKEVHVFLSRQRHLHKVEITAHAYDHALAGAGSDSDLASAMTEAIEKFEKQIVKMQGKFRASHRIVKEKRTAELVAPPAKAPKAAKPVKAAAPRKAPQVFPVNPMDGRKPMTVEEALLEIGPADTYFMFREARTNKASVLMRRPDGHFDLIET